MGSKKFDENLLGKRFGKLTIVSSAGYKTEPCGHKRLWVNVVCDCTKKFSVELSKLIKRGKPISCKKCSYNERRTVKIGEKFDKLTVVGYQSSVKGNIRCLCDCGKEVYIRNSQLRANLTNSCGCSPNGAWKGFKKISGTFFHRIKRNAKNRGIAVEVSIEQLWELYQKQNGKCALTGLPIDFNRDTTKASTASLDRIDSTKGYFSDNIQWVHKNVNLMKMDLPEKEFFKLCALVTNKHKRKENQL